MLKASTFKAPLVISNSFNLIMLYRFMDSASMEYSHCRGRWLQAFHASSLPYDMKDFLPSAYEVEKRPKASKPSAVGPSCVLAAYKDSLEDEEVSNHDQGSDSNDNEDEDVNHDGEASLELHCYWESSEEDDSPRNVNEARTKKSNNIGESSSSNTMSDNGGEGMNINDDDNNHGTSNNPLQSEPLLEMPICEPFPISAKKTLVASSSEKPMG